MSPDPGALNLRLAAAFVAGLAGSGLRHAVVCPGSRSTPLALALAEHPAIRVWMHVDERSAAFFGLGIARARRESVALLCSSGTAAANFLPAVVEASLSRVPLVVLTADRPPELRGVGAAQTIDQVNLFGAHAKWFVDLPLPDTAPELWRHAAATAARAVAAARAAPAGPVHVNAPFREPLVPVSADADAAVRSLPTARPTPRVASPLRAPAPEAVAELGAALAGVERGLIACGPQDDPALPGAVAALAGATGFPILADPLSGIRCGAHDRSHVVDRYDAFLRDQDVAAALAPEVVVRAGTIPTSKPLSQFLERCPSRRHLLLHDGGDWRDPLFLATDLLDADPALACRALAEAADRVRPAAGWSEAWRRVNETTDRALRARLADEEGFFEGRVFAELAELLPAGATLFAGNSMPVRDLDSFFPSGARPVRFVANRGANGIDGVASTALGMAAVGDGPVVLVVGDLSFYHDMNGLLAARLHGLQATIVVLNNDGGGIFSFLPQAAYAAPERFEQLFGTPIGLDVAAAARLYGARFDRPGSWEAFRQAVADGLRGDGLSIVEVVTDRARNVAQHRAVWRAVAAALRREGVDGAA